jgi:hypothetical protein
MVKSFDDHQTKFHVKTLKATNKKIEAFLEMENEGKYSLSISDCTDYLDAR